MHIRTNVKARPITLSKVWFLLLAYCYNIIVLCRPYGALRHTKVLRGRYCCRLFQPSKDSAKVLIDVGHKTLSGRVAQCRPQDVSYLLSLSLGKQTFFLRFKLVYTRKDLIISRFAI